MFSSNDGIHNVSYSITDLDVKTENNEPIQSTSSVIRTVKSACKDPKNDSYDRIEESTSRCLAAYRRFHSDWRSISILLFLYTLQGLPMGLIQSIPLVIQEKSASYNQQARFSLAGYPFSFKLVWAPLVDALYFKRIGRRKSWLIPVQYLIAITLFVLSYQVDDLIDKLEIGWLTAFFFLLNFLAATQDIAVDGWALTMLKKENVALASTCSSVGQELGIFIGHAVFLNLASKDFSNKYLRSEPQSEGIITLASFMVIWSGVYFVTTTLIFIFKHEGDENHMDDGNTILDSYTRLYEISKLPTVRLFMLFHITKTIGLAASRVSDLKLVEEGLPKETIALLSAPLIPISILLPIFVSKWTAGRRPLRLYASAFAVGVMVTGIIGVMVWVTGLVSGIDGYFPGWYIPVLLLVECAYKICTITISVSDMAFCAKISDPEHGATFMTFYNTMSNLGTTWPTAVALWLIDPLTITRPCIENASTICDKPTIKVIDGYYIETIACIVLGFCWFFWARKTINKLQKRPESDWRIKKREEPSNGSTTKTKF